MIMAAENIQIHIALDKLNSQKECDLKAADLLEGNTDFTDVELSQLQHLPEVQVHSFTTAET